MDQLTVVGNSSVSVRRASTGGGGTGGSGGSGGSGSGRDTGDVSTPAPAPAADNPPIIAGGTREEFNVSENMTAVTSLSVVDGRTVTWNISGGFDAAEFTIGAESGELMFRAAPDFENPTDEGANNVYVVEVGATDSDTLSDTLLVLVTVTDVVDESTATPEPTATAEPTAEPTAVPTAMPTLEPTAAPTLEPTPVPTPRRCLSQRQRRCLSQRPRRCQRRRLHQRLWQRPRRCLRQSLRRCQRRRQRPCLNQRQRRCLNQRPRRCQRRRLSLRRNQEADSRYWWLA